MKKRRQNYFPYTPGDFSQYTRGKTAAERGVYMDETDDALRREEYGVTALADAMMRAREESFARTAANFRGRGPTRNRPGTDREPTGDRLEPTGDGTGADREPTEGQTKNQNQKPKEEIEKSKIPNQGDGVGFGNVEGGGLGGAVGNALRGLTVGAGNNPLARFLENPREAVWQVPDKLLPDAAALYFGGDRERVAAGFRKTLVLVGATSFRAEFGKFVAEDAAGENGELKNRAGAFHARLKNHLPGVTA